MELPTGRTTLSGAARYATITGPAGKGWTGTPDPSHLRRESRVRAWAILEPEAPPEASGLSGRAVPADWPGGGCHILAGGQHEHPGQHQDIVISGGLPGEQG